MWQDRSRNEDGFRIERSRCGNSDPESTHEIAAQAGIGAVTDTVTGLISATCYSFHVAAFSAEGESARTQVSATTPALPLLPPVLDATPNGTTGAKLEWHAAPGSSTESVEIERRQLEGGTFFTIQSNFPEDGCYGDGGLSSDTEYEYRIRSVRGASRSAWSPLARVRTNVSFIEDVSGLFDRRWSSLEDPESGDVKKCSTCHASALDAQCDPPTPEVCEEENGCFTLIYAHEERHREVTGEYSTCSDREARIDRENPPASLLLRKPTLESGIEHEGGKRWSGPDEAAPGDPYNVILRWIQQGAQLDTAPPPACVGTD